MEGYKYHYSDQTSAGIMGVDAFREAEKFYKLFKPSSVSGRKKKPVKDTTDLSQVIGTI